MKLTSEASDPGKRLLRFPTIDQRVQFYMSSWYEPPCDETELLHVVKYAACNEKSTTMTKNAKEDNIFKNESSQPNCFPSFVLQRQNGPEVDSLSVVLKASAKATHDLIFALDKDSLDSCQLNPQADQLQVVHSRYCPELRDKLLMLYQNQTNKTDNLTSFEPAIAFVQIGDSRSSRSLNDVGQPRRQFPKPAVPHFTKIRPVWDDASTSDFLMKASSTACATLPTRRTNRGNLESIIWKMGAWRHYKEIELLPTLDVPWENKRNTAVFRGVTSGYFNTSISPHERCFQNLRCRLVLDHHNSTKVDARFSRVLPDTVPTEIENFSIVSRNLARDELLKYKMLVFIEGNDVASGLKWGLYSNSVVMIPKPTVSSWAMEELLEPYVHYIPLKDDLSDMDTQIEWILSHDREAQKIASRGQLWIRDLLFDDQSDSDNRAINGEMLRRYEAHFRPGMVVKRGSLFQQEFS